MISRDSGDGVNAFQTFSTLLALLLPVLQFFFNFVPASAQAIFVIKDVLVPVTIIAGVFSYLLIIAFKNTIWFSIPFNRKKHNESVQFQQQIEYVTRFESDPVKQEQQYKQLLKNPKNEPFYLTPLNIYYVLIPLLMLFALVFLAIGIFGHNSGIRVLILVQAITYIFSISLTSLTLAVFYINESNHAKQQKLEREKYQKIKQLLFETNSLSEFPNIEFLAQIDQGNTLQTVIRVNYKEMYDVMTDKNADTIQQVIIRSSQEQSS